MTMQTGDGDMASGRSDPLVGESATCESQVIDRRPYTRPQLRFYGHLTNITQSTMAGGMFDAGGMGKSGGS